jgi:hypothetical protein
MIALLQTCIVYLLKAMVAAIAPLNAYRKAEGVWTRRAVIVIHVGSVATALCVLIAAQIYFGLDAFVRSSSPLVRTLWLPIVGGLTYATAWSVWLVARTLNHVEEKPVFDAVTTSLRDGLERLSRAGIDPDRTPLYLVLGAPAGGIREFFASGHVDLSVLPNQEEAEAPIQVCGNRDAIYVCCNNASLTSHFARKAAISGKNAANESIRNAQGSLQREQREALAPWRSGLSKDEGSSPALSLLTAHQCSNHADAFSIGGTTEGSSTTATLAPEEASCSVSDCSVSDATIQRMQDTLGLLESITATDAAIDSRVQPVQLLQPSQISAEEYRLDAAEAEELLDRLRTLCNEIVEIREPYCPINGVLVLVPLMACDSAEAADHVGMRLERDFSTIIQATEMHASAQVVFCDLELCEGSQPFLQRFPEGQRHRRLGAIVPASPASEPQSVLSSLDQAAHWVCNELFPPLGHRLMTRDLTDPHKDATLCIDNHRIQRLVQQMRDRCEGMSRLLRRAVAATNQQMRIRGCFVAATGIAGHMNKQAFCEGVVPMILDMQNEVQWTRERRVRDRSHFLCAVAIYTTVVVASVITFASILGLSSTL